MLESIKTHPLVVWLRITLGFLTDSFSLSKNNGTSGQLRNIYKRKAELQIRLHAIEKGMSIGKVRKGFGKEKVLSIIKDLDDYMKINGDVNFVSDAISILDKYIAYNENLDINMGDITSKVGILKNKYNITDSDTGGIIIIDKAKIDNNISADFKHFSQSRYSIRDFSDKPIEIERIKSALKLCERTPSACNRQSWRIHVYSDKKLRDKIFNLQGGNRGFTEDMQCAILICCDFRNYGFYEQHLPYVDGGIYAMNLLYALNSEGLATIPLTMSHKSSITKKIKKIMGIPDYELPILLIGVGTYKDEFKVALSQRSPFENYVKFNS